MCEYAFFLFCAESLVFVVARRACNILVAEETGIANRRQALRRGRRVGGRIKEGMIRSVGDVYSLFWRATRFGGKYLRRRGMILFTVVTALSAQLDFLDISGTYQPNRGTVDATVRNTLNNHNNPDQRLKVFTL